MYKKFYRKMRGSLTIEASIILPLVIVTLLFVANILNICMVHLSMQQALNNTVKKISQNSYIVYRFAGEERYTSLINTLNDTLKNYSELNDAVGDFKSSFDETEKSVKTTVNSIDKLVHTFDGVNFGNIGEYPSKLVENVSNLASSMSDTFEKSKKLIKNIKTITNGENLRAAFVKLSLDTGIGHVGGGITNSVFEGYKKDLNIPASKIESLDFFNTAIGTDGKITFCIAYYYSNPFSFINSNRMEHSIVNKKIKMTNLVTIRPFVGQQGSSLRGKLLSENIGIKDDEELVWIPDTLYNIGEDDMCYHSNPNCSNMHGHVQKVRLSDVTGGGVKKLSPCSKCYEKGVLIEIEDASE